MAKREGSGEAKVYKGKDGRWRARVTIAGKRVTTHGRSEQDCLEWVRSALPTGEGSKAQDRSTSTLGEYLQYWLTLSAPNLRPKTIQQYEGLLRNHIVPGLGNVPLSMTRTADIQSFTASELASGAGPTTVGLILGVLHRALGQAQKWGMLDHNPATGVIKPRRRRREMRTLSPEQTRRLLAAAAMTRLAVLLQLAVTTGLRQGELLGLRWSDIQWEPGCLVVQRQAQRVTGRGLIFIEPKTAAGRRKVVLGPAMLRALRAQCEVVSQTAQRCDGRWQELDLVFPCSRGTPQDPRNLLKEFKGILKVASLPDIRFHDLRHTAASLMLTQGIHPKVVQERLGHSQISITLDVYSHVLPSLQGEAAAKMDAILHEDADI